MTFEETIQQKLEENGMWSAQAQAVIAAYKADSANDAMDRWSDDVEGYPIAMLAVLWMSVQHTALEWIDTNKPLAWYRPMFLSPAERDALLNQRGNNCD